MTVYRFIAMHVIAHEVNQSSTTHGVSFCTKEMTCSQRFKLGFLSLSFAHFTQK